MTADVGGTLVRYDAARRAIAEAKAVDEVKEIRNAAIAMAAYAKQAKDRGMEADAAEIRMRATRRLGEMMDQQKNTVGLAKGGQPYQEKSTGLPDNPVATLASQGIDKNLAHEARKLGGMTEEEFEQQVEEAREYVAYGKREILDAAKAIRAQELQQRDDQIKEAFHRPTIQVDPRLHVGDFRDLAHVIPDNSVELVFTDPPYDRDSVPLYEAAAVEAARVLKPGGSMICYTGQVILPDVISIVSKYLKYFWTGADVHKDGPFSRMDRYGIIVGLNPLLWFVKDHRGDRQKFICDSVHTPREKDVHPWQKPVAAALHFIDGLTSENGVVVDFFAGGGTTIVAAQCVSIDHGSRLRLMKPPSRQSWSG